jgi:hypothetical protein
MGQQRTARAPVFGIYKPLRKWQSEIGDWMSLAAGDPELVSEKVGTPDILALDGQKVLAA